jgi:hypothetical protein
MSPRKPFSAHQTMGGYPPSSDMSSNDFGLLEAARIAMQDFSWPTFAAM